MGPPSLSLVGSRGNQPPALGLSQRVTSLTNTQVTKKKFLSPAGLGAFSGTNDKRPNMTKDTLLDLIAQEIPSI